LDRPAENSWFKILAISGLFALFGLALVLIACPCGWSFLMDDVTFGQWMPKTNDVLHSWREAVGSYWDQGRFFPLTFLINIVKWRFLPLDPALFRILNTLLLLAGVGLGSLRIVKTMPETALRRLALLFLLGYAVLQRPLLDIAAINSISEGWVVFFFAAGMLLIDHPILYRIAFLSCAMSKEPAILCFFASGVYHFIRPRIQKSAIRNPQSAISGVVDLVIFAALAVLMAKAKSSGNYLAGYSLFGVANVKQFAIGLVKCSIALIPVAVLLFLTVPKQVLKSTLTNDTVILCLLFGVPYLYLAASWSVAGYLLIPPAFCFFVVGGVAILEASKNDFIAQRAPLAFIVCFALVLCISLYRFERSTRSIHEPLIALKTTFFSPSPRLVILQGVEPVIQGNIIVKESGATVTLKQYDPANLDGVADFPGDVVLLEATSYFGRYPDAQIEAIGATVGGWTQRVDGDVYRLFYARHTR
jgi:hypothetical protein